MATAWDKLEQLLTCAICLDRFRNPKMLPCQHSFCQEPCMDGLQDYARRQIKCPECRAEHRIPFHGIQSYPTNVTLQRFLELHQSITGEEPDPVPTFMERCGVCSEKSLVTRCCHCDKKVCPECKEAHLDILKREISRICHQVRRALNRLQDALTQTERTVERLNVNSVHIRGEIEEIVRRFVKDIKSQEEKLLKEIENYHQTESKSLTKLREDLEIEYNNMKDNCDLVEKGVLDPDKSWNDTELVECKEIFVKTLDFLRNFDADTVDYTRGMKFIPNTDLDALRRNLINFGELKLPTSAEANHIQPSTRASSPLQYSGNSLSIPQQNALMRSQSDHRLASQFGRRDSRITDLTQSRLGPSGLSDSEKDSRGERSTSPGYSRTSTSRRDLEHRIGRYGSSTDDRDSTTGRNRYLRDTDSYRSNWSKPEDDTYTGPQFKSRFMREKNAESTFDDHDTFDLNCLPSRSVRFEEAAATQPLPVKVFDTEAAPRGPLSGIVRIGDTTHFMERTHENEARSRVEKTRQEEEPRNPPSRPSSQPFTRRPPSRQVSEDEIEKQKKMNKAATITGASAANMAAAAAVTSNLPAYSANSPLIQPQSQATQIPCQSQTTAQLPSKPVGTAAVAAAASLSESVRTANRRSSSLREDDDRSACKRSSQEASLGRLRDVDEDSLPEDSSDISASKLGNQPRRRRGSSGHEDSKEINSRSTSTGANTSLTGQRQVASNGDEVSLSKEEKEMMMVQDTLKSLEQSPQVTNSSHNQSASSTGLTSLSRQTSLDHDLTYYNRSSSRPSGYSGGHATQAISPLAGRRASDIAMEKYSRYSSMLRSRSPSLEREALKSGGTSNRSVLSRTNSVEEQGRYSYSRSSQRPSRLARSSTVSFLASSSLSSPSRYSSPTFESSISTRGYRSRPASPVRYISSPTSSLTSSIRSTRRYQPHHYGLDSSKALILPQSSISNISFSMTAAISPNLLYN